MEALIEQGQLEAGDRKWFTTTHWSVVMSANGEGEVAREALEELCVSYWYPLYLYVRRQGFDATEAEDLTQGFFEHLLQRDRLGRADGSKGRFRTFLLAAIQNYLNDCRDHAQRVKRGGRHTIISWDAQDAESRYAMEPADEVTPEVQFDRRWAAVTLGRVRERMRSEFHAAGKGSMYDLLSAHADGREFSYEEIAGRLNTTEVAVKSAAHRLRQRLREVLWEEVAQTVSSPQEMEMELRTLVELAAAEGL
jgi:RNA polymerase sigma factor (sigma-70 family)